MSQPANDPASLSGNSRLTAENRPLTGLFWSLLTLTTVLRCVYALKLPLTGDEAYFWEWARHPALGYYDHPPMAGWILWFTRLILGDTVYAIRLPAVLAGAFVVAVIHRFALDLTGSRRAASLTGILTMGIPLIVVFGILFSTDTPLLAAGTLGGYLFYLAVEKGTLSAWLGTGICFAVLLASKFLGAPLIAACFLYLLLNPTARRHLKHRGPYFAAAVSLTGLIPVILWNARHHWATFAFNLSSRHEVPALGLRHAADYLAGQAIALSPLVFVLAVPVVAGSLFLMRSKESATWRLPAFLAAVPLGGFFLLSFITKIGIHWPGIGVPFLAAAICANLWQAGRPARALYWSVASAWIVSSLIFALPVILAVLPPQWEYPLRPEKINSAQIMKYTTATKEIGNTVGGVLDRMQSGPGVFTFTRSYALSSLVAFYTPGHPEVTVLGGGSAHGRNHLFWFNPGLHRGENAVFVTYSPVLKEQEFLSQRFQRWEAVTDSGARDGPVVSVVMCYGYNGKR